MFYKLEIKEIIRETDEAVSLILEPSNGSVELFEFKAGQYLTFKYSINDREERRSYSICAAPHENVLKVMAKEVKGGLVSVHMNKNLSKGQFLESMPPSGKFTIDLAPVESKQHTAFAAGSGITPIISIIKDVLFNEPKSSFTLYYGNRDYDSIIFRKELQNLENDYKDRFTVHHFLSREQVDHYNFYGGRLTEEQIKRILQNEKADEYYLCGPEPMINSAKSILTSKNVSSDQIHFELFTTSELDRTIKPDVKISTTQVSIKLDGLVTEIEMKPEDTVLNAAIDKGLDVPYACQGGTCCTCQAKLLEGEVTMDVNMVLTDKELEQGYILTCQSHPKTDNIVVDYDDV